MTKRLDEQVLGPSMDRRAFREQLMRHMALQKMTPSDLASAAGISKDAISTYTTMRSLPTEETLAKIAKALKCKPAALMRAMKDNPENATLVEIREYSKKGFKLLIARVPVPEEEVSKVFDQLLHYAKKHGKK